MKVSFWTEISGKSAKVMFHDNGQLARWRLVRDITIRGRTFDKGDAVYFDRQRKLIIKK